MTTTTASAPSPTAPVVPTTPPTRVGPIIVAVGGADSDGVLAAGTLLASRAGEGVLAVSVLEPLPPSVVGESLFVPATYEEERFATLTTKLAARLERFRGGTAAWPRRIVRGDPSFALADLARSLDAPLIIMGLGRHRPLDRVFGAETTLRVVRRAPCPVLAVDPELAGAFQHVVVATDFSPACAHAAEVVLPLLGDSATLQLVHIWEPSGSADARLIAADEAYATSLPEKFRRFVGLLELPTGITVKTATREGKAAERVLDFAEMHHADLIVAGRQGRNALERLFVGSQTTAILRGARRSVLVVPEPSLAERDRLQLRLTGATESFDPGEWESQFRALSQRSHGRTTVVTLDHLLSGVQVVESGYRFLGAAYDPKTQRLQLNLGDTDRDARHVMRTIAVVHSVAITADSAGKDQQVRISHAGGQTTLSFPGE